MSRKFDHVTSLESIQEVTLEPSPSPSPYVHSSPDMGEFWFRVKSVEKFLLIFLIHKNQKLFRPKPL